MTGLTPHLVLKEVRKVFIDTHRQRQHVAVDDFNYSINAGELVTILGPSGCGKTTVLRMIAGFESPTAGDILLKGALLNPIPPNQRNSAMVFQSYALFPHMNVAENISYGLGLRKLSKAAKKERLARAIELVGLGGYEERQPNELSGGQQQRVALARALVIEPDILLFDEPLSNLDAKLRNSMRIEIRRIQKQLGITAVYVTHDQDEAMAISDQIIVMREGKIEQAGTPHDIYVTPINRFVADFIGAANFATASMGKISDNQVELILREGRVQVPYINNGVAKGQTVSVVIRPENLRVIAQAQPGSWQGTVVESIYLGRHTDYRIKLPDSQIITVRARHGGSDKVYQSGETIHLSLLTENLHYFKDPGAK